MSEAWGSTGAPAAVPLAMLLAPGRHRADAAAARLERARAEAFEAGRAAGEAAAAGRIEALAAALRAAETAQTTALAAAEARAAAATAAIADALADGLSTLGLAVARAVLAAEPRTPAETLAGHLARLLAALPDGVAGRLCHAPGAPVPPAALPPGWVLAEDPALDADALRAELGAASLGISLAQQLDAALARLEGEA